MNTGDESTDLLKGMIVRFLPRFFCSCIFRDPVPSLLIVRSSMLRLQISLGGRRLNSLRKDGDFLGCETPSIFDGPTSCAFGLPILGDLEKQDNGAVVNLSYSYDGERASQYFNASKNVVSSSTGGVQEVQSSSYSLDFKNTQRFSTRLNLSGSKSVTISGADSSIDVTSYRFEPSISYKLDKNWNLSFLYRHIKQNRIDSNVDSTSNAVYVNLYFNWPKLATTY